VRRGVAAGWVGGWGDCTVREEEDYSLLNVPEDSSYVCVDGAEQAEGEGEREQGRPHLHCADSVLRW
jgi:hypothetical protein